MRISDWSSDVCSSDLIEMMAEDEVPKAHLARHVADQRGQYLQIASVPGQLCKMMRIREPTHLVPRNQYSPSSSRHQRAIMTKTLKINHERMQHAPTIVIDGAPVLSSRFITQLRKWLSHVLRQRVPFQTI